MEWLKALLSWFKDDASGLANFIQIAGGAIAGGSFVLGIMRRRQRRQETYEQSLEQALATRKEQLAQLEHDLATERLSNPSAWLNAAAEERREGNEDTALKALGDGVRLTAEPMQNAFAELAKDEISRYPVEGDNTHVEEALRLALIAALVKPGTQQVDDLLREIKAVRAMRTVRAGVFPSDSVQEPASRSFPRQDDARAAIGRLLNALYSNAQEGRYLIAERLGFRACEIASRSIAEADRLALRARFAWAQSLELCGLLLPAITQFDELVSAQRTALGDDDDDTLASQQIRARVLCHLSRHDQALNEIETVIERKTLKLKDEDSELLVARLLRVEILDRAGRKQEALSSIGALLPSARKVWGPQDRRTFSARYRSARLLGETAAFDEALKAVDELIAEEEATLGADHHVTLEARALRASLLFKSAPRRMALSEVDAVLEPLRRLYGPEHHETLDFRHMRAQVLRGSGQLEDAYAEAKKLPTSFERVYGADNPDTLAVRHVVLELAHLLGLRDVASPQAAEQLRASIVHALGPAHAIAVATERLQKDIERRWQ